MKLGTIAERLGCVLEGDPEIEITGVRGMDEAGENDLTFLANPKYIPKLKTTRAGAIILGAETGKVDQPVLRATDPYLTFARAIEFFYTPPPAVPGVHPTAVIAPTAKLGHNPSIAPYVVIEDDVEIGDDCVLKSFVTIYRGVRIGHRFFAHSHSVVREYCRLGDGVTLQNGAIIGSDGFGFARKSDGSYYKIVQSGIVALEDEVEVQAHSCVDRATVGETRLSHGVKVDNLVQVGHGCHVGANSLLCAQVGLGGTTRIGRNCVLTGQVGVVGHCSVGDKVIVTPQSGVAGDVEPGKIISGAPAVDHDLWLKSSAIYSRLPEIYRTVRKLKDQLQPSSTTPQES